MWAFRRKNSNYPLRREDCEICRRDVTFRARANRYSSPFSQFPARRRSGHRRVRETDARNRPGNVVPNEGLSENNIIHRRSRNSPSSALWPEEGKKKGEGGTITASRNVTGCCCIARDCAFYCLPRSRFEAAVEAFHRRFAFRVYRNCALIAYVGKSMYRLGSNGPEILRSRAPSLRPPLCAIQA